MATKAQIDAIFANVATGQPNTAVEALANWNALKNELYPTHVTDTQLTTNIITKYYSNVEYSLTFVKRGSQVNVYGYISVTGSPITFGELLINFNSGSEYKPKNATLFYIEANRYGSSERVLLRFSGASNGEIITASAMPTSNVNYYINANYNTND